MLGLIVAGEAIFGLPFQVARFFRPTVLEVFGFTNTELGSAQAVYGVLAMLAYFPGGPLADLYMATFPGLRGSMFLWGFYGVSTILLFWAALIRATRDWGGAAEQGRAYGILDGGRGLVAAGMASLGVVVFGYFFPEGSDATLAQKTDALRWVIYGYSGITLASAALVWFVVSDADDADRMEARTQGVFHHIGRVLRMPLVWVQAIIVICAYVGFKGFDNYSLFAVQVYGMEQDDAARLVSWSAWVRPVAAIAAGLLADRITSTRVIVISFAVLLASDLYFAVATPEPTVGWVLLGNTLIASSAIFALRGVYFALFEEANVPTAVTGTAVGLVSVIGYTPDVFVALVGGILLDRSPGLAGHQHYFFMLAGFAALGLVATVVFIVRNAKKQPHPRSGVRLES